MYIFWTPYQMRRKFGHSILPLMRKRLTPLESSVIPSIVPKLRACESLVVGNVSQRAVRSWHVSKRTPQALLSQSIRLGTRGMRYDETAKNALFLH